MSGYHVVIIGGGITGLSAAWYLQKRAEAAELPVRYTILERSSRWGGKILTEEVGGYGPEPFVVEAGPDSFITQKPWALELARELGLERHFLPTNDDRRKVFVLNRGRLTPLPDGMLLIVPTRFLPFARSPLISLTGKLRMAMDLVIPARTDDEDETLAEFVTRRLGSEALDKIAEPLMSGIYNAEADKQSLLATFPRFREIEKRHGSLIRGMLAARRRGGSAGDSGSRAPGLFVSFEEGMQQLVDTLASRLTGDCRLGISVESLARREHGYTLALSDGSTLETDAVILAVPAYVAASLLRELAPEAGDLLRTIRYVSTGTVSLAFRAADVDHPLDGFGLVIPAREHRPINALTWTSTKFDKRAPEGHLLLRAFFGGSRNPKTMELDDASLLAVVRDEIQALMGIGAPPLFQRIYRWFRANPQYDVGHLERVAAIEAAIPPAVYVTGSAYRGIGIPDCIRQAQETVDGLLGRLPERLKGTVEQRTDEDQQP